MGIAHMFKDLKEAFCWAVEQRKYLEGSKRPKLDMDEERGMLINLMVSTYDILQAAIKSGHFALLYRYFNPEEREEWIDYWVRMPVRERKNLEEALNYFENCIAEDYIDPLGGKR